MKILAGFFFTTLSWSFAAVLSSCSTNVEPPKPYGAIPSERQLKWHEMETYCLIHYTPTTFQNKEWGFGDADPALFDPTGFDAVQIAQAASSAGFKGLISVAKHHDGFCLWPTKTNGYNITKSPWKDGKGDMVKEFMEAARGEGLSFGVYLSAWDRHDPRYGSNAYTEAYRAQLTELMTGYGELFTSWHDGANGGDGYYGGKNETRKIDRTTYYEWQEKTWPIVRQHQPMAMIFSDIGPDMRWVGNEKGFADETSWATMTPKGIAGAKPMPGAVDEKNLPTGDRNGEYWIPAECDVPLRSGWFYHPDQDDKVKTPDEIFEIYLKSVGRGANMNLGLAPMPQGKLHDNDVRSLTAFGEKIKKTFAVNLAGNATIKASNVRGDDSKYGTQHLLDDDRYSYYASDDDVLNPTLEIDLDGEQEFDLIRLRENIKLGQRLDSVNVDLWDGQAWSRIAAVTSIGATRLIKLDQPVKTQKLRLQLFAPVAPALSDFGLFLEAESHFERDVQKEHNYLKENSLGIRVLSGGDLSLAMDNDPTTFTTVNNSSEGIVVETSQYVRGIYYLPVQNGSKDGLATKYRVEGSNDNKNWSKLAEGEFSNIKANPVEQTIIFKDDKPYRYIRFTPLSIEGNTFKVAEFGLFVVM